MSEAMLNLIAVFAETFKLWQSANNAISEEFPILTTCVAVLGVIVLIKNSKLFNNRHKPY